jgi:uracil phosphoribosyltransferase
MRAEHGTTANSSIHVLDHPIARHALIALRDQHTTPKHIRYYSHQLLTLLTIEATRNLPTRSTAVEATYGVATGEALSKPVIFISLNRHGLGLSHQVGDLIPDALVGSISLDNSTERRVEPRLHLSNAPALHEARVIVFDPVVGSGLSAGIALALLRRSGANDMTMMSFIMSSAGVPRILTAAPETALFTAAIDTEFDPKRGPLPGIGKFSHRFYDDDAR